jgi:signal peptidase I
MNDRDQSETTDPIELETTAEPAPTGLSTSAPEPYVFRPAQFKPAVFIPAELPHHGESTGHHAPAAAETHAHPAQEHVREGSAFAASLSRVWEELLAWFKTLVSAAVYATIIVTFGFQVARVEGQSMVPTLEDQDRLIVNKLIYRWADPRVGDVVMLYYPEDPEKSFVKRIVAEEGDTIRSAEGKVYRNEVLMDDSFIPEEYRMPDTWGPYVVKRGYYFVMGDHRNNSSDSRAWGEVPKKYIIGKVQVRWWPLGHAKIF